MYERLAVKCGKESKMPNLIRTQIATAWSATRARFTDRDTARLRKFLIPAVISGVSAVAGIFFNRLMQRPRPYLTVTSVGFAGLDTDTVALPQSLLDAFSAS